jgi:hypothetical protein
MHQLGLSTTQINVNNNIRKTRDNNENNQIGIMMVMKTLAERAMASHRPKKQREKPLLKLGDKMEPK